MKQLEKDFILDGVPLSKIANDEIGRTQPSFNIGIPQYSALGDPACKHYFASSGLKVVKAKNGEKREVGVFMRARKYLQDRKKIGAGKKLCSCRASYIGLMCLLKE